MNLAQIADCARLCQREYDVQIAGVQWGNDLATVTRVEDGCIVAFRGTANTTGWLTDLEARPVHRFPWPVAVHQGFADAVLDGAKRIFAELEHDEPLVITGHSRGGAMAALFGFLAKQRDYNVSGIVTFGEPRSFAGPTIEWPIAHIRAVHELDPIPHVPIGFGYQHVGQEFWLTDCSFFGLLWARLCRGFGIFAADAIRDHYIENYVEALQRRLPGTTP